MAFVMAGDYLLPFIWDFLFLVLLHRGFLLGSPSYGFGPRFLITTIVCVKIFVAGIHQSLLEQLVNPMMRSHVSGDEDAWKISKVLNIHYLPTVCFMYPATCGTIVHI